MTKKEIIYRLSVIAHTAQDSIPSSVEERESMYKELTLDLIHDEIEKEFKKFDKKFRHDC